MLEKTAEKFHDIKFHGTPAFTAGFFIPDEHNPILNFNNAMVGDGHFENIGCKIFDTAFAGTDGLTVDIPVNLPDIGGYLRQKPCFFHLVAELCPEYL